MRKHSTHYQVGAIPTEALLMVQTVAAKAEVVEVVNLEYENKSCQAVEGLD